MCEENDYFSVQEKIQNLSKGDLMNALEDREAYAKKLEDQIAHLQQNYKDLVAKQPKADEALNNQIRFSNALDNQLNWERQRRARAEALLNQAFHPSRHIRAGGKKSEKNFNKCWIPTQDLANWRTELELTIRDQEAAK